MPNLKGELGRLVRDLKSASRHGIRGVDIEVVVPPEGALQAADGVVLGVEHCW